MNKSQLRVLPTCYAMVKRQVAEDPAVRILAVEQIVSHVNTVMACSQVRGKYRCEPEVGSFWQVPCPSIALSPSEVLLLQRLFEEADWPDVRVNYWGDRCTVTLAEHAHPKLGPAFYNGVPAEDAASAVGAKLTARQKRADAAQKSTREFAYAA